MKAASSYRTVQMFLRPPGPEYGQVQTLVALLKEFRVWVYRILLFEVR